MEGAERRIDSSTIRRIKKPEQRRIGDAMVNAWGGYEYCMSQFCCCWADLPSRAANCNFSFLGRVLRAPHRQAFN
jgi:hypothetical protein